MKKHTAKRIFSLLLALSLIIGITGMTAIAGEETPDGSSEPGTAGLTACHTKHDSDCGYSAADAAPCTHACDLCAPPDTEGSKDSQDKEDKNDTRAIQKSPTAQSSSPAGKERSGSGLALTINGPAGNLRTMIETELVESGQVAPSYDYSVVEKLTITGAMTGDDNDFIRAAMGRSLKELDISGVSYSGNRLNFAGFTAFEAVKLPADVATDSGMFYGCTNLTTLSMGDNPGTAGVIDLTGFNTTFGTEVFNNCTAITTVKLPANIAIAESMFANCTNLTTLSVGDNPGTAGVIDLTGYNTTFGNRVFNNCTAITTVKLPANIAIAEAMFVNCTNLTTLSVGDNPGTAGVIDLTGFNATFGDSVFNNCTAITTVKLPANIDIPKGMFSYCTNLTTLSVGDNPGTAEVIDLAGFNATFGSGVFGECTAITMVKLPANIAIPNFMFYGSGDDGILTVLFTGKTAPTIGLDAFNGSDVVAYVPDKTTGGYEAPAFCHFFSEVRNVAMPAFTTQPQSQHKLIMETAVFTTVITGDFNPTPQWQVSADNGTHWTDIAGETNATLMLDRLSLSQNGYQYRCVAQSLAGRTGSDAATLKVEQTSSGKALSEPQTPATGDSQALWLLLALVVTALLSGSAVVIKRCGKRC